MYDNNDPDDIQILDVENYRNEKDQAFSQQSLVMSIFNKLIKHGSVELREGYINDKGLYVEDTRKRYIETVKTAIAIMTRDFDEDAKNNIKKLLDDLKTMKEDLIKDQWNWYENLRPEPKRNYVGKISRFFLNKNLDWFKYYSEYEIEIYRQIEIELHNLTARLNDYESPEIIA